MLSNDEQTALLDSIERIRARAANHLRSTPSPSNAVNFVANLHSAVDKVAQQTNGTGPKTECQAGCAYCCGVRVEATDPEVFLIARELRKRPAAQVNALIERLKNRAATAEMDDLRSDCAFLENHLCSIYEVRPAVCRKAHSLSAKCCRELAPEIPQDLGLLLGAEALMRGTSDAYHEVGLCAAPHELCNAVLLALVDETAETRWHNGESVFADGQA